MTVLIATKLTQEDHDAREVAGLLAKRMNESVVLAHVLEHDDTNERDARTTLDRAATELQRFGIETQQIVLHGAPASALLDYVRRINPKIVVVGRASSGTSLGFAKARELLARSGTPILYVPSSMTLMSVLASGRRPRVLATFGRSAKEDAAVLEAVRHLRELIPTECTFVCTKPHAAAQLAKRADEGAYDLIVASAAEQSNILERAAACPATPILFVPPKRSQPKLSRANKTPSRGTSSASSSADEHTDRR